MLIPAGVIRAEVIFQHGYVGFVIIGKFSVGAIGDTGPLAIIPKKSIFVIGNFPGAFTVIFTAATAIAGHPVFFHVVRCITTQAPVMAVCTHFGVYIKIIEEYKISG